MFVRVLQRGLVFLAVPAVGLATGATPEFGTASRTRIAAVKRLTPDDIAAGPNVCINGVVTWCRPGSMFVQDDTAGIFVNVAQAHDRGVWPGERLAVPAAVGSTVEIEGTLDRGGFSPPVLPRVVRVAGTSPLPQPRPVESERFFRGADDGDLVGVSGVVQNVVNLGHAWQLTLRSAGNTLLADVAISDVSVDMENLVDGVVRVAGPTAAVFTSRGEFIMPRVHVDRPEWLALIEPARRDPFESPRFPLDGLDRYRHEPVAGHRVCTEGVVVHALPGLAIFLQDGPRGIRVQTKSTETLVPGDRVEVAGFIDRSGGVAGLANALVRRHAAAPPPEPLDVTPAAILDVNRRASVTGLMATPGDYEGCLVRFPATLVEVHRTTEGGLLVLDAAGTVVTASTDEATLAGLRGIRADSDLAVTGIVRIQWGFDPISWPPRTAEAMTLLVRSPADIAVVRAASWWTPRRLAGLVAAAAAAFAGAMCWVWLLRQQVGRQARALATEMQSRHDAAVEFEAALRERNRLAANLHDTVLQTVTGIGFQLQACRTGTGNTAAEDDHRARIAERMVDHAIKQLRGTVWALHALPPTGRSLGDGLRALADRVGEEHDRVVHCRVEGVDVGGDDTVSGALLLVAQEALHNALRHAQASVIEVLLRYEADGGIALVVRDDGRGFETGDLPGPNRGHFGVEGMIDRMQRIGGSLRIDSRPLGGTLVTAVVPAGAVAYLYGRTIAGEFCSGPIGP